MAKLKKINDKHIYYKRSFIILLEAIDTLKITELPIGKWTQNYKEFLESIDL